MSNESLIEVVREGSVAIIHLNRPKALNALCDALIKEIIAALSVLQADDDIGAIVLTGNGKAFAAGADIKEMRDQTMVDAYMTNFLQPLTIGINAVRKPIIAAVNGYALGGGCELAMLCDIIYAGEDAVFGQPEIKVGTIPGAGGTQRLIRAVGKSKAMHIILTGGTISAVEAERAGLVTSVHPVGETLQYAVKQATIMASYSRPMIYMAKECINASQELSLTEGLHLERRLYHATFGTEDLKEGMGAFIEKRQASFKNK
ncbi:putative enoyl-CoA hydratase, mitochondrial [Tulasnella sp. JGI-2019a]|nr:putative enoyl-CoA hydratase, mitochondrial [Tulasnella sp. JGI-2019a]KAG9036763.1 putative enoyl-CoA hydratase, mitochondrial [Tulasnella sp. JGI-2019a]